MIKRKGDWFYYYDSNKNVMGRLNIYSEEFVGATSCMMELHNHIMMIKKEISYLYKYYEICENYRMGICSALELLESNISKVTKRFIKSKFPKEYYNCFGIRQYKDSKGGFMRFNSPENRKKFLIKLNSKYGITTTINETV